MRKKTVEFVIAGVLVLVFGVASTPARAELNLEILTGQYSPHLRAVNEEFDEYWNNRWGTDFGFKAQSFKSKTGGTYRKLWEDPSGVLERYQHDEFKWTVTPVIISGIYKFSPFYIGAGIGSFSSELQWVGKYDDYLNGSWMDSGSESKYDSDSPAGVVLLTGLSFGDKPVSLNLEARYIMLAKAKLKVNCHTWETEADFGGLQLGVLAGVTFG